MPWKDLFNVFWPNTKKILLWHHRKEKNQPRCVKSGHHTLQEGQQKSFLRKETEVLASSSSWIELFFMKQWVRQLQMHAACEHFGRLHDKSFSPTRTIGRQGQTSHENSDESRCQFRWETAKEERSREDWIDKQETGNTGQLGRWGNKPQVTRRDRKVGED